MRCGVAGAVGAGAAGARAPMPQGLGAHQPRGWHDNTKTWTAWGVEALTSPRAAFLGRTGRGVAPRLRALSLFGGAGWQDSRVVRDLRGPCSEKAPFVARSSRGAFPKGDLQGFSDTWRAYLAIASSFRIHGGDMLP